MIGIHHREGSFSDKWIEYCEINNLEYKFINCYENDIINQVQDCKYILWHWHHSLTNDKLFALQLIQTFENMGKKVFPNIDTCWHYDDKVGQKYLLESIKAPFINTYVFYDKDDALKWIEKSSFPKVFKLRGGAGANNVSLCKTKNDAIKLIKKSFSSGFNSRSRYTSLKEKIWQFKKNKSLNSFINISKGLGRVFLPHHTNKNSTIEKNYIYFQEFIPLNNHDIRVIIIGSKAFAIKRLVREGDFRASGSRNIDYNKDSIPIECVKIAFETSKKLFTQSAAYDFIFLEDKPLIIEISFAFAQKGYLDCKGYWDENLNWIETKFFPEYFMIENLLND